MSKWINKFLGKESSPLLTTDNTDRFNRGANMSVLEVTPRGNLDQNMENIGLPPTDSTDRFNSNPNMSVLSVPPDGLIDHSTREPFNKVHLHMGWIFFDGISIHLFHEGKKLFNSQFILVVSNNL